MGICSSCQSISIATAKLILEDGTLQEFSFPVKVSYILQKNPSNFVCSSDDMDIGDVVLAVSDYEELQLGQIYFLLPKTRLKHRLQPEEMAALAVKASSALQRSYCDGRRNVLVFPEEDCNTRRSRKGSAEIGSRRMRRKVAPRLSAIPE